MESEQSKNHGATGGMLRQTNSKATKNMQRTTQSLGIVASAMLFGLASMPAAAISTIGNCDVNDVTSTSYGAADACYGLVDGNIEEGGRWSYENVLDDAAFFAGDDWAVRAITFNTTTHAWSGDLAGFDELIIVLKQSTLWGAWYFNPADSFGTWSTVWDYPNGNDGQGGGLSHGFALVRGTANVPEPGTLGLFGLSMLGLAFVRRRRS